MLGLIPFNRKSNSNTNLARTGTDTDFRNFYNMLDDFFSDSWMSPGRNLLRGTFKIDIEEIDSEYRIEAELPGFKREKIGLNVEDDNPCISVNRTEESNENEQNSSKNYIHRERRSTSMARRVRLANANLDEIKAKLADGMLTVTIPKDEKTNSSRKIEIG